MSPLRGWLLADALSLTGTRLSMVALPWFVLTTTGSPTKTGLVALFELAPLVLLKVLGGPVIDRVGARRVAIACDLGSVVAVGTVPVLHLLDALSFPVLLLLVALAGALRGPGDAARHALVPELAAHAGVPVERVTGMAGAVERTAGFAGAAIAGALVALLGAAEALLLDAASFGASALLLSLTTRVLARPPAIAEEAYLRRLRAGWDFLRRDPLLVAITGMVAVTNLLDVAYSSVLVPVWAASSGRGAGAVGLLFAVTAAASVVGSLVATRYAEQLPRFRTVLLGFLLCGGPKYVVLALGAPLPPILVVMVVGGFASGFLNPVLGAVIFERIPEPLVGRVSSLSTAICWGLMPLGGVVGGLLVAGASLSWALAICGAAYFLAAVLPALLPTFRAMDVRPEPTAAIS